MPAVEEVSPVVPSFPFADGTESIEDERALKPAKVNGSFIGEHKDHSSSAVSQIAKVLKSLKESIPGDPLLDSQYVTLLKVLRKVSSSVSTPPTSPLPLTPQDSYYNGYIEPSITKETLQNSVTEEQRNQLLAQIRAYRCLSRNLPVPPHIVEEMGAATMKQPVRTNIVPFMCPPTLFRGSSAGSNELVASAIRDAIVVAHEREKRIHSKIQLRTEELKMLPTNIVPSLKKQAQVELKQLKLLDFQKKIRGEISKEVKHIRELESALDMEAYRKSNPNMGEDEEIDIDGDGEQSKYAAQRKFLIALHYHAKEFKEFHIQRDKNMKKLIKSIQLYHKEKEKREAAKAERERKERINYLRNNDVEAYENAIKGMKNDRLQLLMKQTGDFLAQMGILVAKEKELGGGEAEGQADASTTLSSKTYYTAAHTIQEEVKEQPEMLVGGTLKEYQLGGVQWLISLYNNKLNGILADEMGLGKTIQTIGLITYLIEKKGNSGPFMIAVPLSTVSNWTNEFEKWAPKVNVVAYKGKPSERKQLYLHTLSKRKFNVVLVSFEYIMIDKNDLGKINWEYLILDEGHRIKNKNSKLSTTLRTYVSKHRLLLTGTPLQNDLSELWALLNFLLPTIFNSVGNFENWFNSPFAYDKVKKTNSMAVNEEESLIVINRLHQVLRPFLLRRLKADVESQLPDKVERILKCSLSSMQNVMYEQIATTGVMMTDPNSANYKRSTRGFNNVIMQLQKVCNHPYLFRDEWDVDENMVRVSGKFELMDRMLVKLKATKHRVLIFTQMTHVITIMELYFGLREFDYLRLDGQTKQEERATLVKEWNRPDSPYFIFVLSTHAGGLGLNLQTADTVIIFDTDWNPHMDLQAQDRAHRIGQTQEVRVFRLVVQNSLEEKILDRASFKLNIDAKIIQAGMFNNNASDEMRREMLEGLLRGYDSRAHDDELVTTNDQLNSALARTDAEFEIFQKMDEDEEVEWKKKHKKEKQSRLITYEELPAWMVEDPRARLSKEAEAVQYGKGKRQRSEINYDDGLTENQFLRMMDKGMSYEDVRAAQAKRREARSQGLESGSDDDILGSESDASQGSAQGKRSHDGDGDKKPKKKHVKQKLSDFSEEEEEILDEMCQVGEDKEKSEKNGNGKTPRRRKRTKDEDLDDSVSELGDGDEDGEAPRKKQKVELKLRINLKGEKPSVTPSKEKAKEKKKPKEGEGSLKKRGRKPKGRSVSDAQKAIWHTVRSATDDSGRVLSALFMELPSAQDYPNYYDVIDNPVSLSQIKRKKYTSMPELRKDFLTMFDNAKEYNEATSQVYADANTLLRTLDEAYNKFLKEMESNGDGGGGGEENDDADEEPEEVGDETKKKRGRPKKEKSIIIKKELKTPVKEEKKADEGGKSEAVVEAS